MNLNHYKSRNPKSTIKKIEKFFKEKGFTIKPLMTFKTEIGSYSSHFELWYGDKFIATSNGKGITKNLSIASGLAELYERFCNFGTARIMSPEFLNEYRKVNPFLPKEDAIFSSEAFLIFCANNIPFGKEKEYYDLVTRGKPYTVPYKDVVTGKTVYYDPRVLITMCNSTGMVAGNSFEEAFTQGFSEMLERQIEHDVFFGELDTYYEVDQSTIKTKFLKKLVKNIEDSGFELHILDFAYITSLPVICSVLIDKKSHCCVPCFGSHPSLDIAIERTITELWQGIVNGISIKEYVQVPRNYLTEKDDKDIVNWWGSMNKNYACLQEHVFDKLISLPYEEINKNYVQKHSVKSSYDYYIDLIKRLNLDVYVKDNSLSDSVYALHIYSPQIILITNDFENALGLDEWEAVKQRLSMLRTFVNDGLHGNFTPYWFVNNLSTRAQEITDRINYVSPFTNIGVHVHLPSRLVNYENTFTVLSQIEDVDAITNLRGTPIYDPYKTYTLLIRYKLTGGYTDEEIEKILTRFGCTITQEDFDNWRDSKYLYNKIFFEPTSKYINSEEFKRYMKTYECKK